MLSSMLPTPAPLWHNLYLLLAQRALDLNPESLGHGISTHRIELFIHLRSRLLPNIFDRFMTILKSPLEFDQLIGLIVHTWVKYTLTDILGIVIHDSGRVQFSNLNLV